MLWRDLLRANAGAGLSIVSYSTAANAGGTTLAFTTPSGAADGDILLAWVVARESGSSWTPGSGFTEQYDGNPGAVSVELASLELTAAPAGSYTFTCSTSQKLSGIMVCIRAGTFGLIGSVDSKNPLSAPGITMASGGLLFGFFAARSDSKTFSTPTGMTAVASDSDATAPSWALFSEEVPAGATGNRATSSSEGAWAALAGIYEA